MQFIIKHDRKNVFYFASLQSKFAQKTLLHANGLHINHDSVVYQTGGQVFVKSQAAFKVIRDLGGFWKGLLLFQILPKSLLDWLYDFVANHRYSWFGKKDKCIVPTVEIRSRFLDEI